MKGFGVFFVGNRRIEVRAAAEPALGRGEKARVHMHGGHVRVGHMRDEADAAGEEMRVFFGAGDAAGELGRELASDGRDVDSDLLEHLAGHLPADSAAASFAADIRALPRAVDEGRVAARFALDFLKRGADTVAQRLEPIARRLLLFIELEHLPPQSRGEAPDASRFHEREFMFAALGINLRFSGSAALHRAAGNWRSKDPS